MKRKSFSEIWKYRELLFFLAWRDVKIRYRQTALGAAWAVIQPLFTMLVFTLLFGKITKVPSDGIPYPIFAYSALLLWTYFSVTLGGATSSLVGSGMGGGKSIVLKLVVDPGILMLGMLFALVMGCVGGLLPAIFAMRVKPLESLR